VLGDSLTAGPGVTPTRNYPSQLQAALDARGADALVGSMIYNTTISPEVLDSSPDLRIVAKYSIGCEDVDVDAATERGILVTVNADQPPDSVSVDIHARLSGLSPTRHGT